MISTAHQPSLTISIPLLAARSKPFQQTSETVPKELESAPKPAFDFGAYQTSIQDSQMLHRRNQMRITGRMQGGELPYKKQKLASAAITDLDTQLAFRLQRKFEQMQLAQGGTRLVKSEIPRLTSTAVPKSGVFVRQDEKGSGLGSAIIGTTSLLPSFFLPMQAPSSMLHGLLLCGDERGSLRTATGGLRQLDNFDAPDNLLVGSSNEVPRKMVNPIQHSTEDDGEISEFDGSDVEEDEMKIEKLGRDMHSKKCLRYLREVAPRFKRNILIQTQQKRQTKYVRKKFPNKPSNFKYRYHNIYKNYLRDVKVFFKDSYDAYKLAKRNAIFQRTGINLNYQMAEALFFFFLLDFVLATFDRSFLLHFAKLCQNEKAGETDDERLARLVRKLAFDIGCFMVPKQMILRLEPPKELTDKFKRKIEDIMPVFLDTPHARIFRMIISQERGEGSSGSAQGQHALSLSNSSSDSVQPPNQFEIPSCLGQSGSYSVAGGWRQAYSVNFYGLLAGDSKKAKKAKVTEIYRLFFRFSVEKLFFFVDDFDMMTLFLHYLAQTWMRRAHSMMSLRLNSTCYYRATENMINESNLIEPVIKALQGHPQFAGLSFELLPVEEGFTSRTGCPVCIDLTDLELLNGSLQGEREQHE